MDVDIFPTQPQEEGLDFTLNQGGSEHVTLEDVFQRFCQDDGGEGGSCRSQNYMWSLLTEMLVIYSFRLSQWRGKNKNISGRGNIRQTFRPPVGVGIQI